MYICSVRTKSGKYYIGITSNIEIRLSQHNEGRVDSTQGKGPWRLVYYEAYENKKAAAEREVKLKKFGSAYTGLIKRLKIKLIA